MIKVTGADSGRLFVLNAEDVSFIEEFNENIYPEATNRDSTIIHLKPKNVYDKLLVKESVTILLRAINNDLKNSKR